MAVRIDCFMGVARLLQRRKRAYTARDQDLAAAFRVARLDQVLPRTGPASNTAPSATPPSDLGVWFSARSARGHPDEAARAGSRDTILAGVAIQPGPGLATRAQAQCLELYC